LTDKSDIQRGRSFVRGVPTGLLVLCAESASWAMGHPAFDGPRGQIARARLQCKWTRQTGPSWWVAFSMGKVLNRKLSSN